MSSVNRFNQQEKIKPTKHVPKPMKSIKRNIIAGLLIFVAMLAIIVSPGLLGKVKAEDPNWSCFYRIKSSSNCPLMYVKFVTVNSFLYQVSGLRRELGGYWTYAGGPPGYKPHMWCSDSIYSYMACCTYDETWVPDNTNAPPIGPTTNYILNWVEAIDTTDPVCPDCDE